jgi:hypothetical protein
MPALMTHHLFGERAVRTLEDGTVEGQEELLSFLIGCQGPDPFFFRASMTDSARQMHQLAHAMHNSHVIGSFSAMRRCIRRLPRDDQRVGMAFALGFLAHYALDSITHPFIYAQQEGICEAGKDDDLEAYPDEVHAVIESELDTWMVWKERHATIAQYPPAGELMLPERASAAGGALCAFVARYVYGLVVSERAYGRCVADMRWVYRHIEPYGSPRYQRIGRIERLVRPVSHLQTLAHEISTSDECPAANLGHLAWADPSTGEVSTKSFYDLYGDALEAYPVYARAFLDGEIEGVFGDIDFDGRPLSDDRM